jgi:archaellum biogenesis ATPase FlaH
MKPLTSLSAEEREKLSLLSLDDLAALPDPVYLIDGVLPANVLGVLYGAPGAGKSFIALDMALAIASGREWLGRETRQGKVLYVAAEGALGMKLRIAAYQLRHAIPGDSIRFLPVPFDARSSKSRDAIVAVLAENAFKPDLIIVDTLARVAVGADENSAQQMGEVVEGFETLRRGTEATILVIHHTRKDGEGFRGSSALEGAVDVMIECTAEKDALGAALKCKKMKDDEPFDEIAVEFEKVDLPGGRSSLVVAGKLDRMLAATEADQEVLKVLETSFAETGATHKEWREASLAEAGIADKTFNRVIKKLREAGKVRHEGSGKGARYYPVGVSVTSVSA